MQTPARIPDDTAVTATASMALVTLLGQLKADGYHHTTISPASHTVVLQRPWQYDPDQHSTLTVLQQLLGWSRPVPAQAIPAAIFALGQQAQLWQPTAEGLLRSRLRVSSLAAQSLLFWHSAYPTERADTVFFGPDSYRFVRAISAWLDLHQPVVTRAAEVFAGAGPAAILLALRYQQAEVFALDINPLALQLCQVNAQAMGANALQVQHSNLLHDVDGGFDLIVANPPYLVDAQARTYRHGGGPLGAGLSLAMIEQAQARLRVGGTLLLYTGVAMQNGQDPFWQAVCEMALDPSCWQIDYQEIDPDVFGEELMAGVYAQADRIAAVLLTLTRRA